MIIDSLVNVEDVVGDCEQVVGQPVLVGEEEHDVLQREDLQEHHVELRNVRDYLLPLQCHVGCVVGSAQQIQSEHLPGIEVRVNEDGEASDEASYEGVDSVFLAPEASEGAERELAQESEQRQEGWEHELVLEADLGDLHSAKHYLKQSHHSSQHQSKLDVGEEALDSVSDAVWGLVPAVGSLLVEQQRQQLQHIPSFLFFII